MIPDSTSVQLGAWLATMKTLVQENDGFASAPTLLPPAAEDNKLWAAFASSILGSSAAPVEIGRTLAEGGMGVVRLAEQPALGRTVVVKTMRGQGTQEQNEQVLREAWATGALEHPNIVPVHDVRVNEAGAPVIVLKRIEGDCWTVLMHNKETVQERFGVRSLLEWNLDVLRQITQAIRYAHSKGILHRDLKPDNVMIGEFGEVYLVDWGIALRLDERADSPLPAASEQSAMAGTPCYLAPEMLGGAPLDQRTDIYLLGAVLYEIIVGIPPHSTDSVEELVRDIRASNPSFPPETSSALQAICCQAMAAKACDRFESATAFAKALRAYQQRRGSELLSMEADSQMQSMTELLTGVDIDKHDLYQRFGAIRFGYENAINTWESNELAIAGLRQARLALIDFELVQENPQGALAVLNELTDPPPELVNRVDDQIATQNAAQQELLSFRTNSDKELGRRTRIFLLAVLGFLWTVLPLGEHLSPSLWRDSYWKMIAASSALWALSLMLFFWARESLTKTDFNKRLSYILNATFPTQIIFFVGAEILILPHQHTEILMLLLWGGFTASVVATVDRRFFPSALGYLAGFLLACRFPESRFLFVSGSHAILTINGIYLWRRLGRNGVKN